MTDKYTFETRVKEVQVDWEESLYAKLDEVSCDITKENNEMTILTDLRVYFPYDCNLEEYPIRLGQKVRVIIELL